MLNLELQKTLTVLENARTYAEASIKFVKEKVSDFDIHKADENDYEEFLEYVPEIYQDHWYATIFNHLLTQKARKMLKEGPIDIYQIGSWMNAHKNFTRKNSKYPEIMKLQMKAALNAGAIGAKIIGSGGGGCMVAMVNDDSKEKVIRAFKKNGAMSAYEISLISPV